ncbi:LPS translocon maturation chaperone LptM [Thiohalorhabdus methylotrophus]|uniref:Lipoprotein n=1 Tax=Thiohalorhabdus methylotrophus TaxID=3242694 RepID=A0ABV4TZ18_9GAMM
MTGRIPLLVAVALVVLGGCGQKGPLYRPEPETQQERAESAPDAAEQTAD